MKFDNKWRNKQPNVGKRVMVHAYKYNGWLYRTWEFPLVILSNDEYIVLACDNTLILTDEYKGKRTFRHHKPELFFWIFFKKNWYNMIIEPTSETVLIKINLASLHLYEESAIKYIDFELDYKVNQLGEWKELDRQEFINAIDKYKYPKELVSIVEDCAAEMIDIIQSKDIDKWMSDEFIAKLVETYHEVKKHEKPTY